MSVIGIFQQSTGRCSPCGLDPAGVCPSREIQGSRVEAVLVRNRFAVLNVATHDSQIHRPAVAGDPPMLVLGRPAGVIEAYASAVCAFRLTLTSNAGSDPVWMSSRYLQFECRMRLIARHLTAPIVFRAEEEAVFSAFFRLTLRTLGPPSGQPFR